MSSFVERISVIIDTKADQATSAFKSFRTAVADANGIGGKFKAGWQQVTSQVGANIGKFAVAGGAALVAFGIKALSAFQDTAAAAREFGDATGMSTEAASRWIAVADDMGTSADALETSVKKIAKSLDGGAWERYGVATHDAAGDARSTNDILLDSLDMLGKVQNETDRARIGNELFGKGYADIAPIVGKTRAEYEDWLNSVEKGQVITAEEEEKAERMRKAQDALSDALGELTLAFGGVVAGLSPLIELLADGIGVVSTFTDGVGYAVGEMQTMFDNGAAGGVSAFKALETQLKYTEMTLDDVAAVSAHYGFTAEETARLVDKWNVANGITATSADDAATAIDRAEASMRAAKAAGKALNDVMEDQADAYKRAYDGALDLVSATLDVADAAADQEAATQSLIDTMEDENATQAEKDQAYRDAIRSGLTLVQTIKDQALASARATGAQDGTTASAKLQIAELERQKATYPGLSGEIDKYIALLKRIPGTVTTNVGVQYGGGAGGTGGNGTGVSGDTGNLGTGTGAGRVQSPGGSRIQSFEGRSDSPIVIQLVVNDKVVQEFTVMQEAQRRGTR